MKTPPYHHVNRAAYDAAREYRSDATRRDPPPLPVSWQDRPSGVIRVAKPDASKAAPAVSLVAASSITPEPIKWLWPGWLAGGKMHVLAGAPGAGKTTIALRMAATISAGGTWPDGRHTLPGNVIIWSGEDDPTDTLAPRLIAANANMSRIFFVGETFEDGKKRPFDPATDLDGLRAAISKAGGAALLIVDPIVSAVSGDSHKNSEVRRSLQPLVDMAASIGAAVLGISHFSKGSSGREPTERVTGSLAFSALARIVLIAAKRPDDDDDAPARVLMRSKSNIGPDDGGFEYQLIERELIGFPEIEASVVEWGAPVEGHARDVLADIEKAAAEGPDGGAVDRAATFLRAILASGPLAADDIRREAEAAGVSWAAIRRAKKSAGVVAKKEGYGGSGGWLWAVSQ